MVRRNAYARLLLAAAIGAFPQDGRAQEARDPAAAVDVARPNILIDLAHATKMSADEAFLAEDRVEAERGYLAAQNHLDALAQIPVSRSQEVALLRQDIAYRRELLRAGLAFWGALYSTKPLNPVAQFTYFSKDVAELNNAIAALQGQQDDLATLQLEQLRAVAAQERNTAEGTIATLEGQRAEISDQHHQRREDELRARITRVRDLQDRLRVEQRQALAQLDQQRGAMNALLMEGVGSALGVPPELTSVANGGNLRAAIISAGTRLVADPQFVTSLGEVGEAAALVSDVYGQGQRVVDRVNQGIDTARQLNELVRRPTLEKLTALGARVYSDLDESTRRGLDQAVRQARPLVPLLEFARSNAPVTQAVRGWLANNGQIDRLVVAAALVDEHRGDFARWYTETMRRVGGLDLRGSALEQAFDQTLRGWPSAVYDRLPPAAQRQLLQRLGAGTKEEAIAVLRRRGIEVLPVSVEQGAVSVPTLGVELRLQDILQGIDPSQVPSLTEEFEAGVEAGLARLASAERRILDDALAGIQMPRLEQILGGALERDPQSAAAAFDSIIAGSGEGAQPMLRQLAQLQAGSAAAADPGLSANAPDEPPGTYQPPPSSPQSAPGGVDALRAALAGPLGAVFPQAKVAQMAVSWVAGNMQMISTIDRINRISAQMERYVLEEIHLRDSVEEAEYRQEIAIAEQRIANARRDMSVASARRNQEEIGQLQGTAAELRSRIINAYRVANIFYLAERVRFNFDGLNRALRAWTGSYDQGGDVIRTQTYGSPDQLRLALDPQIRLFERIGDPNLARQRADLDRLAASWQLLLRVAEDLCRRIGCSGDNPSVGLVDFSPTYRLSEILGEIELQDFRAWQSRRQPGTPFRAAFLVHPLAVGRVEQAPAEGRRAVRVIDVGVTSIKPGGRAERSLARLTHPGVGYVEGAERFYTETLIAARAVGGRPMVSELRPSQQYAQRWAEDGGHSLGPLEGYSLFTEWIVDFPANADNWLLEDVELRFAYQYQTLAPATEAEAREALLRGTLLPISLTSEQIGTIGSWEELRAKVERWSRESPGWTHGLLAAEPAGRSEEPSQLRRRLGEWIAP